MEELSKIKKMRKKLGITQHELARKAGVSQSLIAKVESGKIEPSYSNAKKLFETLSMLDKSEELKAKDIMYPRIISVRSTDSLKDAILKMRRRNISQMPVMKHKKIVGYISEAILLENHLESESQGLKVCDVMEPSPPIVPPETTHGIIANILRHFPFVLVEDKGEAMGIITKADLLKALYSQ